MIYPRAVALDFNPHFRKGSDVRRYRKNSSSEIISIHTSAREVTALGLVLGAAAIFQSTLPQGKWPSIRLATRERFWFQSTLPQGKWRRWCSYLSEHLRFQSTLPQGKWLTQQINSLTVSVISIHTSAREVTLPQINKIRTENRFQSTLPQGKWLILDQLTFFDCKFQSTLPQGKWREWLDLIKGYRHFNPHFRKGSDSLRS